MDGTIWLRDEHYELKSISILSAKKYTYYNQSYYNKRRELEKQETKKRFENGNDYYQELLNTLKEERKLKNE